MSKNYPPHRATISIRASQPMDIVKEILERNFSNYTRQIKSESSYRKIHEIIITILDTAEGLEPKKAIEFMREQLPRAYVIIEYQNVRGQISNELRELLLSVINELTSAKEEEVKGLIRKARLLLDSLAVIAKYVG